MGAWKPQSLGWRWPRAISELPDGYRVIFILHEVDGYQHREIAELLGCSVGTSKSQLHKAKLRIRELLTSISQTQPELLRSAAATTTSETRRDQAASDPPRFERRKAWITPLPSALPANATPFPGELRSAA